VKDGVVGCSVVFMGSNECMGLFLVTISTYIVGKLCS